MTEFVYFQPARMVTTAGRDDAFLRKVCTPNAILCLGCICSTYPLLAATVAIRYATVRRQGNRGPDGLDRQIITYPSVHHRHGLLPILSRAYVYIFARSQSRKDGGTAHPSHFLSDTVAGSL